MAHDPKACDITVAFEGETPTVSVMELQLIEAHLEDLIKTVLLQAEEKER